MTKHKGKWKALNIDLRPLYSKIRSRAKSKLIKRHKREYADILHRMLKNEYKRLKGGNK